MKLGCLCPHYFATSSVLTILADSKVRRRLLRFYSTVLPRVKCFRTQHPLSRFIRPFSRLQRKGDPTGPPTADAEMRQALLHLCIRSAVLPVRRPPFLVSFYLTFLTPPNVRGLAGPSKADALPHPLRGALPGPAANGHLPLPRFIRPFLKSSN